MHVGNAGSIIGSLVDIVSKNGTLLLNLSPKSDGTIPREQQETLLNIGKWLAVNGEAIYDTHNWIQFSEEAPQPLRIRFTVKGDALYAIIVGKWPDSLRIKSLASGQAPAGEITSVTMLGYSGPLTFSRDAAGLTINLPPTAPCDYAYALKITGLTMNPPTNTPSGNPVTNADFSAGGNQE